MTTKPLLAIAVAMLVVFAGCATLAGDRDGQTETPSTSTETVTPIVENDTTPTPTPAPTSTVTTTPVSTTTEVNGTPDNSAASRNASANGTTTNTNTATPTSTVTPTPIPAPTATATPTPTPPPTATGTPNVTETGTNGSTSSGSSNRTMTVQAVGGRTSDYRVYVSGPIQLGPNTENTDQVVSNASTYAQGITGDGARDVYQLGGRASPRRVVNDGNVTLEIYVNGELIQTAEPGLNADSTPLNTTG